MVSSHPDFSFILGKMGQIGAREEGEDKLVLMPFKPLDKTAAREQAIITKIAMYERLILLLYLFPW